MARRKRRGSIKGLSMLLLSRFAYKEYKRSSRRRKKKVSNNFRDFGGPLISGRGIDPITGLPYRMLD